MRVTFPHIGNLYWVAKPLLEDIGYEVVMPPKPNRESIELGVRYSPEFICFPLKAVLGDFIRAAELGAEVFFIFGGQGPCRFGWYGMILENILHRLGYKVNVVIFDDPREKWARESYKFLKKISPFTLRKLLRILGVAFLRLKLSDFIEELARKIRPLEIHEGATERAVKKSLSLLLKANGIRETKRLKKEILKIFSKIEKKNIQRIPKIGMLGEIYMTLEPSVNFCIEEKLGKMGVWVDRRAMGLLTYLHTIVKITPEYLKAKWAAKPYLKYHAGGKSTYSVGYALKYAKMGYDGIIHISPLGCMPEIVAQTILNRIEKDYNIPILNVVIDEHTSETGLDTRLEAFVDLLKRKNVAGN